LKISVFRDITPCSPLKFPSPFNGMHQPQIIDDGDCEDVEFGGMKIDRGN
jgi:hypothetical protein